MAEDATSLAVEIKDGVPFLAATMGSTGAGEGGDNVDAEDGDPSRLSTSDRPFSCFESTSILVEVLGVNVTSPVGGSIDVVTDEALLSTSDEPLSFFSTTI